MLETIPWANDVAARTAEFGPRIAVSDGVASITYDELAGRASRLRLAARFVIQFVRSTIPSVSLAPGNSQSISLRRTL